jgi:hypothetical protein
VVADEAKTPKTVTYLAVGGLPCLMEVKCWGRRASHQWKAKQVLDGVREWECALDCAE